MNPYSYNTIDIQQIIEQYQQLRQYGSSMYREAMWQYADMASGGDGGPLGYIPEDWPQICVDSMLPVDIEPTCRAYNYPGYPDDFFQEVLAGLQHIEDD